MDRDRKGAMARARRAAIALLPLLLGACVTAIPSVDVTRFHGASVTPMGRIAVLPADPQQAGSLEFRTTANAVAAALRRVGYAPLERGMDAGAGDTDFEALVTLDRVTRDPALVKRSPVSVGVGGSTGTRGSGVGVGIGINLSGPPKPLVTTLLRVQIRRAADGAAIWEGRAEMSAKQGSPAAQPGIAAGKLANALFKDFPGPSGVTITVK